VDVQRMSKDAAVGGDVRLLKQAMLHGPLVGAVCDPEEVWPMADEMLVAPKQWLPNYGKADFAAAKKRLKIRRSRRRTGRGRRGWRSKTWTSCGRVTRT
jgi:alpha-galactosidase